MPRYRLRTLLILTILVPPAISLTGPGIVEQLLDLHWRLTVSATTTRSITNNGEVFVDGKSYGRVGPGETISYRSRGRVYVNGKLRQPE